MGVNDATIGGRGSRTAPRGDASDDVSLLWLVAVMLRERRIIAWFTGIGLVLALAVGLLRDRTWTSTFSFVPQEGSGPGGALAGLAGLAGQFNISLDGLMGSDQPPELYADILLTREVLAPIARDTFETRDGERLPLPKLLKVRGKDPDVVLEKTLREMRDDVVSAGVVNRTTGMVGVKVRTKSPRASYAIAQRMLAELDKFNTITRQSEGRAEREFAQRRLAEARDSLRVAEESLASFLERNRALENSPSLTFARERLERRVSMHQQLFTSLAEKYEEARLKEVRDTPVITMIERPVLPARPDSRMLSLVLVVGLVASLIAGMLYVIGREALARERARGTDPALALIDREWRAMRSRTGTTGS